MRFFQPHSSAAIRRFKFLLPSAGSWRLIADNFRFGGLLAFALAVGLIPAPAPALAAAPAPASAAVPATSFLDRLPRSLRSARGLGERAWVEWFYGSPAEKKRAMRDARRALVASPDDRAALWTEFTQAESEGRQFQASRAALALVRLAPNDPAAEWAARYLSAHLGGQGTLLATSAPELRSLFKCRFANPVTAYMLGRLELQLPLPRGTARTPAAELAAAALATAGRPQHWRLYGPFGFWPNLAFDTASPLVSQLRGPYRDGNRTRPGQSYDARHGGVLFPPDWGGRGAFYAVSFLRVPRPLVAGLRVYSPCSVKIWINGAPVVANDRRARYSNSTAVARLRLQAGWNRVVVMLAGDGERVFNLMLRPENGAPLASAERLPAGARLSAPPRLLPPPPTIATWASHVPGSDPVKLWLDGAWRMEDGNPVAARPLLLQASRLAPQATPIWLALAQADQALPDAGPGYSAAQTTAAARRALAADPSAVPAWLRQAEVAESQGKTDAAAAAFQRCWGRGLAVCDWEAFRFFRHQGWTPEALRALRQALAESPSDWAAIGNAAGFAQLNDARLARSMLARMALRPRAAPYLGMYWLTHGRPQIAVRLLTAAIRRDPSSARLRRDRLNALLQAGENAAALAAAKTDVREFPDDWKLAALAAGAVGLARGRRAEIAWLQAHDFNRNGLRRDADFLAGSKFWLPWYHSARQILAHAPSAVQYPNASAILVFDQMVDRINPDHSRDAYIHQIFRVLDKTGIAMHGTVQIPPGSDLITIRTLKPNGSIILPERMDGRTSISMPGLEPGDYIETEYVEHFPPSSVVGGALDNDMYFIFNSNREPYNFSDYVVLSPRHFPLTIQQARFPGKPKIQRGNDWTSREWLVQKTRMVISEPNMPPYQRLVPKVWVSSPLAWRQIAAYWSDRLYAVRRFTPSMRAQALRLTAGVSGNRARADTLFAWVAAHIRQQEQRPGEDFSPGAQDFHDRSGSRLAVFLGLLSAARVPWRLALARAVTDNSSLQIPNIFQFTYPLVRVGPKGNRNWYDLNQQFAQPGYIAPAVRGGLALLAGDTHPHPFATVPVSSSTLDATVETIRAQLQPDGSAQLNLTLEFRGLAAEQIRQALESQPATRLPQIYQSLLLGTYPTGIALSGHIENLHHAALSLLIHIQGQASGFATVAGNSWTIRHLVSRVNLLSRYASLSYRQYPLILPAPLFGITRVEVDLPPGFRLAALPPSGKLQGGYGVFTADYSQIGNIVRYDRVLDLPPLLIPPSRYQKFRDFAVAVAASDHIHLRGNITVATPPSVNGRVGQ